MTNAEKLIIDNLITNEDFARKVLPHLEDKYFENIVSRKIKKSIVEYYLKYRDFPEPNVLEIEVLQDHSLTESQAQEASDIIKTAIPNSHLDSVVDLTEKFIKERAVFLGITQAIDIYDGKDKANSITAIPDILTKALQVGFHETSGHNFQRDWKKRWEFYNRKVDKIPFSIEVLNLATEGGVERKTLNALLAGTGVGKSAMMCDLTVNYLKQGLNVMYFTFEMAEEKIAKRIEANMLNINMSDFDNIDYKLYERKIENAFKLYPGKLEIKEFPTSQATVLDLKAHIEELRTKEGFIPDVVMVDYLTIMNSVRYKSGAVNSYTLYKALAEELRGLAVELNVAMWTGLQLNRSGYDDSDAGITNTADSFGIPMSLDFMVAMIVNDELKSLNQILLKQEKSRYSDLERYKTFVIGYDKAKMRFYDLDSPIVSPEEASVIEGSTNGVFKFPSKF